MFAAQTASPTLFNDVRLSNGVRLHYAQQGPRTGPAVLMLHGYADSWFSFSRVMPLMPAEVRVIVPDQRGHGDSDRPGSGYAVSEFADDASRLLDALDVSKAVVIGHSMGTFVARRLVAKDPGRVTRLVLIGGALAADNAALRELAAGVKALTDPVDQHFARAFQMACVRQPVSEAFIEAVVSNSRRLPARLWREILDRLIDDKPKIAPAQCRTLVIGGRQDSVFNSIEQIALARSFPRGELELVHGIGHCFHWEDPDRFVKALKRFGAI